MSSNRSGFHLLSREERIKYLQESNFIKEELLEHISSADKTLPSDEAEKMVENFITRHVVPVGVGMNFIIDDQSVFVPMATEEPSIIAGACFAAKCSNKNKGFFTTPLELVSILQVSFMGGDGFNVSQVDCLKKDLIVLSKSTNISVNVHRLLDSTIVSVEGDIQDIDFNSITSKYDLQPLGKVITISYQKMRVKSTFEIPPNVSRRIVIANNLAKVDHSRAATHRKGIMNGISSVVLATGNNCSEVEGIIHSFALLPNENQALTDYKVVDGGVEGTLEICLPVLSNVKIEVLAAVGLAQNFAALRALVTKGISDGHMKLHANNIASQAGALEHERPQVVEKMIKMKDISVTFARALITEIRQKCAFT